MGGEEITFTGGEPLLRPDLSVLLVRARSLGLRTVIFTSGTLHGTDGRPIAATERLTALAGVLDRAVFSVYAADPSAHDALTGVPGSLELTQAAVRASAAAGVCCELHFVPTRGNFRELPMLLEGATSLGVGAVRVIRYVPQGRARAHDDVLRLTGHELQELRGLLERALVHSGVAVRVGSGFGHLIAGAPPCTAALDELVVSADGAIHPCSGFTGYRGSGALGSVRDAPLADVWRNAPYLHHVRRMLAERHRRAGGCSPGCLAQKAAAAGILTDEIADPDAAVLTLGR
jgi:pyrroloquinoline quinone biosynthesis protein E